MAPPTKKGTARVVKPKDKPRKSATTNAAARDSAKADGDVHLLWLCFKHNNAGQVDYKAVADGLGITKNAAKQRYYRLKAHFEGLQTPAQTTEGEGPKTENQSDEDQEELPDYNSENEDDQEMKQEQPKEHSEEA